MDSVVRKTCVVFGNFGVQERAVCREMARLSYDVAFNYGGAEEGTAAQFVEELEAFNIRVLSFKTAVGDFTGIEQMVQAIEAAWGEISVLVNSADTLIIKEFEVMTPSELKRLVDENLTSIYYCTKAAIKSMISKKCGRVVNLSSSLACKSFGLPVAAYAAVKAGAIGFTKALAKEIGRYGITVNTLLLGFIQDNGCEGMMEVKMLESLRKRIPCGRFGSPEEVAKTVASLCESASYVNGQVLAVDGGLTDYII